jgi:hypothetical protein
MVEEAATAAAEEMDNAQRPKWHDFERESCKIVLKIAFPKKISLNVHPGAARIAPSSIEKSLY